MSEHLYTFFLNMDVFPDLPLCVCVCVRASSCSSDPRCNEGVRRCVRAAVRGRPLQQRPLWDRGRRSNAVAAAPQEGKWSYKHNDMGHAQTTQTILFPPVAGLYCNLCHFLTHNNIFCQVLNSAWKLDLNQTFKGYFQFITTQILFL